MPEQHEYRVTLRHGQDATHVQVLSAASAREAKRLSTLDAVSMSGGEPTGWQVTACERLASQALTGRAA